jgi:molybdenum cofactor biosynthesis enzyme MoaA
MTFAQNQNEKKVTIDNLKIEVIVTKDASDEVLEKYVKMFAKYDVQLDFGKIKRNATNEITSISISLNHQDRLETKSKIKNNSPINSGHNSSDGYDDSSNSFGMNPPSNLPPPPR